VASNGRPFCFPGARLCEPQQRQNLLDASIYLCAFWLAKLLRVADPRSVSTLGIVPFCFRFHPPSAILNLQFTYGWIS
jgi:hypothetical protein